MLNYCTLNDISLHFIKLFSGCPAVLFTWSSRYRRKKKIEMKLNVKYEISLGLFTALWQCMGWPLSKVENITQNNFSFWATLLLSAHLHMLETWPVPSLAALARFLLQLSSALCVDDALRVCEVDVADVRHNSNRLFINPCPMLAHLKNGRL